MLFRSFLDKEQVIDLDKVKIEIPVDDTATPPGGAASGANPMMPTPEVSSEEEQKRVEELFKTK